MTKLRRFLLVVFTLAALLLGARSADAFPRFALREGLPCSTCHVDPSGGAMRTRYGRYVYSPTRLPLFNLPSNSSLNFDIGDSLAFGGDMRAMYYYSQPTSGPKKSDFMLMEANLYVAANLYRGRDGSGSVSVLYVQEAWTDFQAMGIWQQNLGRKDIAIYVKGGRFIPAYGLRLENHNNYVRSDIGFGPTDKDQGVELGARLGPVLLQGSVLNGTTGIKQFDDNTDKALVGRAEFLGRLGKLRLMAGGSIYNSETGTLTTVKGTTTDARTKNLRFGAHWGAALGRFAYMGEFDVVNVDPFPNNMQVSRSHTYQSYQELDFIVVRGLELNFNYEFRDPNLDMSSGTVHRVSAGFELIPIPHVELKTLLRHSFAPAALPQAGLNEAIAMVHVFF